ncbi:MAG: ABC transporter permease [Ilumatobacteraceae bacterium]|jgi:branched-chain amino acid transport system permease protein
MAREPSWLSSIRRSLAPLTPAIALVAVQLIFFGVPLGAWLRGVVIGLLTALLAMGMALVYRANRVLNFAQADLGFVPATLAVGLIVFSGLPYLFGLGVGLAAAVVLGAIVELAIIRRFSRSPRLVLTVATIGITQLLAVFAIRLPRLWDQNAASQRISPPLDWKLTVGSFILNANDFIAVIVAPVAMIGVGLFLTRTRIGTAVRAAAERSERASLLGIPVGGLSTVVWMIAAALSFLALFLRAGILGIPLGSALAIGTLVQALAALVIGRLRNLVTITVAAVALGVLEYGVSWNADSPLLVAPFIGAAVMAALLLQRRSSSRFDQDTTASWRLADEVRELEPHLARHELVFLMRATTYVFVLAGLVLVPLVLRSDQVVKITAIAIYAIIGLSLVVLTGWAGQISLGQFGFVAIGAAVSAKFTSEWNVDLTLAVLIGAVAGAVAAFIVGLPALRLRGLYLAVTTLVFALSVTSWLLNDRFFSWVPGSRRFGRPPLFGRLDIDTPTRFYVYTLVVLALTMLAVRGIRRSRSGRAILALRDNERAAQSYGLSATRLKLTAFTISGAIAGVAGGLFAHLNYSFDLSSYGVNKSLEVFTASVVGGLGSMFGAVLGAAYLRGTEWFVTAEEWRFVSSAAGVLIVLLIVPGGLGALVIRVRDQLAFLVDRRARRREGKS